MDPLKAITGGTGYPEDVLFMLRYGVPSGEKHRLAVQGGVPGYEGNLSEEGLTTEERRAAGYLFGKRWPDLAEPGTQVANALRFWEPDQLHQVAMEAALKGRDEQRQAHPRSRGLNGLIEGALGALPPALAAAVGAVRR